MAHVLDGISETDLIQMALGHLRNGKEESARLIFEYMKEQGTDLQQLQKDLHSLEMLVWEARK